MLNFYSEQYKAFIRNLKHSLFGSYQKYLKEKHHTKPGLAWACFEQLGPDD